MKMLKKEIKEHTRLIDMHLDRLGCNDIDEYKHLPYAIGTIVKILPNKWCDGYAIIAEVSDNYEYALLVLRQDSVGVIAWIPASDLMFVECATPKSLTLLSLANFENEDEEDFDDEN